MQVSVELGASPASLGAGVVTGEVVFEDLTNGFSSVQTHVVEVGRTTFLSFPMDADPEWRTDGLWAFGVPTGGGGSSGNPDPTSGVLPAEVRPGARAGSQPLGTSGETGLGVEPSGAPVQRPRRVCSPRGTPVP